MELHYGNLIEKAKAGEFDVIIQGCNCFNTMGAGIAKHIKQNFPEAYKADLKTIKGDKKKIGTFSEATVNINGHELTIINAYTQYRYGTDKDHFEYDVFPQLLKDIKAKYGNKTIGLPLIGCGLAGGDEPRILKMIKDNFEGVNYQLVEIDTNRKLNLGKSTDNQNKNDNIIAFTKVDLPYGWMSNMSAYPIIYKNQEYRTTEALFQALRFVDFPEVQEKIIEQKSPMAAKMVAKQHKHLLQEVGYELMGEKDIENMRLCVKLKMERHPNLAQGLVNTKDIVIIEDCSNRPQESGLFWGAAYQNGTWVGKNVLGHILMDYREELQLKLNQGNKEIMENIEPNHEAQPKEYTFFFNLTSPFSNFHPSKFTYKDYTFISNEQFMMFSKAKTFKDEQIANRIINIFNEFMIQPGVFKNEKDKLCFQLASGFQRGEITSEQILKNKEYIEAWNTIHKKIKQLGREVKNYDDTIWSQKRFKVVLFGAREKFTQNPPLKEFLLNTGNTFMIEASQYDKLSTTQQIVNDVLVELREYFKKQNNTKLKL